MGKQKIEVIVNCPDEKELQKMMTKAIADIVVNRIKSVDTKQKEKIYVRIFKCLENE